MSLLPDHQIRRLSAPKLYTFTLTGQAAAAAAARNVPVTHAVDVQTLTKQFSDQEPALLAEVLALEVGASATFEQHDVIISCAENPKPLISPFSDTIVREALLPHINPDTPVKIPSYGLSSYGYDIRLGSDFLVEEEQTVVDVLHPEAKAQTRFDGRLGFILKPGKMALAVSMERICVPNDVTVICMPKSTLARLGLEASITPLEAGWEGYVTLELYNKSANPILLHPGIGIMQLLFAFGEPCEVTYAMRGGKYMNQPAQVVPAQN